MISTIVLATLLVRPSTQSALEFLPVIAPAFGTQPVPHDADDPAIWIHPTNPRASLILGTDKQEETGGLYAFDLAGQTVAKVEKLDRPNNVDIVQGFRAGSGKMDLAVVTERKKERLAIFEIRSGSSVTLTDVTGRTKVFEGEKGEDAAPMGIALLREDSRVFAVVSPKAGPKQNHLQILELVWNNFTKRVDAIPTTRVGDYSGVKETESIAVDQRYERIYYSDELVGTHVLTKDRDGSWRNKGLFNDSGTKGDHEGIAIWERHADGTGLVVCTDQLKEQTVFRCFDRKSLRYVGSFTGNSDETDGIEICSTPIPGLFPRGFLVAMHSKERRFLVYDLAKVERALNLPR